MNKNFLIIEEGPMAGSEILLSNQVTVFGRTDLADVVIDSHGISRRHLQISEENGVFTITDLGSTNGTWLNGNRLQQAKILSNGDRLQMGSKVILKVVLADPEAISGIHSEEQPEVADSTDSKSTTISMETPAASQSKKDEITDLPAQLLIRFPGSEVIEYSLTKAVIKLGRLDGNDIVINVPTISGEQFSLHKETDSYSLQITPAALNPVFVNSDRVETNRILQNGDQISIGLPGQEGSIAMVYRTSESRDERDTKISSPVETFVDETIHSQPGVSEYLQATQVSSSSVPPDADSSSMATMIGQMVSPPSVTPSQLVVNSPGSDPKIHTLTSDNIKIGRHPENDIVIEDRIVSRFHAEIEKKGNEYFIVPSAAVGNPLILNGDPVMSPLVLHHGAKLRISGPNAGEMVSLIYLSPDEESWLQKQRSVEFEESKIMTIGRDPENDIIVDAPTVSRIHAQIERIGQRYRVKDLNSSNGTFVNGLSISGETWVKTGDTILVGPYRIRVGEKELSGQNQNEEGLRIEVSNLNKWVRKDLNILQDISLAFQPREFIVIVGQSGGGKSSLVDAIAGYRPATHGRVIVNDTIDVYKSFDSIRNLIGYVPQKDIIHMELTIFQALDYAARLRMPADTTVEERHIRVGEVMEELDLAHRRDTQISELSGGQQKRVSIGVELLTKPGLFFLDEPTSGLDPGMETELMQLMRRLADQGRTIILITHATKNVMLADRVVFLARGGYMTWFGPPEEALLYFDQFRTERQKRTKPMEFDDIYSLLDNEKFGTAQDWDARFRETDAYQKFISSPLAESTPIPLPDAEIVSKDRRSKQKISGFKQFLILSERNIKILSRDKVTLGLMLLSAPLMASLDFVLASGVGRNPFGFDGGDFNDIIVTLIMFAFTSVMVGGLAMMRELVKERDIYKRERMVNLRLSSYIFSKLWFALLLAVYQTFFFVLIRHLAFQQPHEPIDVIYFSISTFLIVTAGMMMGLFTSAIAPNSNAAPLILVLFLLPQMVLSGALVPLPTAASAPASSRWAFESVIGISGVGSDVAADTCWVDLTQDERDEMTLDEKNAQCNCMGVNALREDSCSFPGLGDFYVAAIDEPAPMKPAEPGGQPEAPVFPDAPAAPENPGDPIALQLYFNDLEKYNNDLTAIQDSFETELESYSADQEAYKDAVEIYQDVFTEYETDRAGAIGSAEATIKRFFDGYRWTFVNKGDSTAFNQMLLRTWAAQLLIIALLFLGTLLLQKSRDVT